MSEEEIQLMLVASFLCGQALKKRNRKAVRSLDAIYQKLLNKAMAQMGTKEFWDLAMQTNIYIDGKDVRPSTSLLAIEAPEDHHI